MSKSTLAAAAAFTLAAVQTRKGAKKSQGAHSPLLQFNDQKESHSNKAAQTSMADREVMSESLTHLSGHINTAKTNNKREVKNSECNASV